MFFYLLEVEEDSTSPHTVLSLDSTIIAYHHNSIDELSIIVTQ